MNQLEKEDIYLHGRDLRDMILEACSYFELHKKAINDLNVFPVPDGDTGTNMSLTLMAAARDLQKAQTASIGEVAKIAAQSTLMGARGNSGVILSQLFQGIARGLASKEQAQLSELGKAFQYGIVYAYNAVSEPVEGTILTVAREIARGSKDILKTPLNLAELLETAIQSGREALERTPEQLPVLKEAGVVDAGGLGLVVFLEGCLQGFLSSTAKADYVERESVVGTITAQEPVNKPDSNILEDFDARYPYCTELVIKGAGISLENLRKIMAPWGDSLVVAGNETMTRIHIHTANPGNVLEMCLNYGSIHAIKIDNMIDQFQETHWSSSAEHQADGLLPQDISPGIGVVAIASGNGLAAIFSSLGADKIVSGGQSMNPSVQEIRDAIAGIPAAKVIVLPNNNNIRLAAEQTSKLVEKEIVVIDTRSVPQGLSAILSLNRGSTLEENYQEMCKRAEQVKTGEITYATRDATINKMKVKKNSIIGLANGKMLVSGEDINTSTRRLVQYMLENDDEILSLFYGQDVSVQEAQELAEDLSMEYPDVEVELHYGGQPLYYYIFSIE